MSLDGLRRRIARIEEALSPPAEEEDIASVVIYDPATGKPLPGYEEVVAKEGIAFWLPKKGHEENYMGYGKDSFLGGPFALLKSHMSFILYLCIIARQEEWELRQAYRAPVEEGAR